MAAIQAIPREVLNLIGEIWGREYGKIQSQEILTLKKVQEEYDEKVFSVNAQSITEKIGKQRDALLIQEYGSEGIKYPWDIKVLLFAKEMGVKLKSNTVFYVCREVLSEPIAGNDEFKVQQEKILARMRTTGQVVSESENVGLQQELLNATTPPIELIRFFREMLDLGKKEDAFLTMKTILDPENADLVLRKRYVDRPPFIDAKGNKIPLPDQPIVGRNNAKYTLSTLIGEPPLYQARILYLLAIAAYSELLKTHNLSEEARSWINARLEFSRYLTLTKEEDIKNEIERAIELNLIKRFWENLINEIRKSFYGSRDFSDLAGKTTHLLMALKNTPNLIYNEEGLKNRIAENIKAAIQFYFIHNFKMPQEDVNTLIKSSDYPKILREVVEKEWNNNRYENFFRELWKFWNGLRANYSEKRKQELFQEFKFAQEQKKVIDSLDTLQKKYFSQITQLLEQNTENTGWEILDRVLAIFGLELTEIALSHPDITRSQKIMFRNDFISFFKDEITFLLPKLIPKEYKEEEGEENQNESKKVENVLTFKSGSENTNQRG